MAENLRKVSKFVRAASLCTTWLKKLNVPPRQHVLAEKMLRRVGLLFPGNANARRPEREQIAHLESQCCYVRFIADAKLSYGCAPPSMFVFWDCARVGFRRYSKVGYVSSLNSMAKLVCGGTQRTFCLDVSLIRSHPVGDAIGHGHHTIL